MYLSINFLRQKSVDSSFIRREIDAEGNHFAAVGGVGFCIALVLDLLEGSFGRAVELELDDIYVARTLHHTVNAPLACLLLGYGAIETEHLDDEIERVLEITLALHCILLALEAIGDGGEQGDHELLKLCGVALAKTFGNV